MPNLLALVFKPKNLARFALARGSFISKARPLFSKNGALSLRTGLPDMRTGQRQLERVSQLPKTQQRFVEQMLETVIAQAGRNA